MKVTSYLGSQERDDVLDAIPQLSKLRRLVLCLCSLTVWYKAYSTNKEVEDLITNSASLEEVDVKLREADALWVKLYGSK